jgi:hypothetical protein
MEMASGVSAQEFENWMRPKQALALLASEHGTDSNYYTPKHTLLERIRGGVVKAVARYSTVDGGDRKDLVHVHPDEWGHVSESDIFWTSGDLTYKTKRDFVRELTSIRHFDVRFESDAVRDILSNASKTEQQTQEQPASDDGKEKPPVSAAHLEAWYELYKRIYPTNTEPHAHKSAQGMFHDKAITRQAIRDLRGTQKPGPKGRRD